MATLDVLDAVRDVADTVVGITSAYKLWPEKAPVDARLPAAIVTLDTERPGFIELAGLERWEYPVKVTLLKRRGGDIQTEQAAIIALVEAFITASRGHANLYGTGAFHSDVFWTLNTIAAYDDIYSGAVLQMTVETHYEVSSQYGN